MFQMYLKTVSISIGILVVLFLSVTELSGTTFIPMNLAIRKGFKFQEGMFKDVTDPSNTEVKVPCFYLYGFDCFK